MKLDQVFVEEYSPKRTQCSIAIQVITVSRVTQCMYSYWNLKVLHMKYITQLLLCKNNIVSILYDEVWTHCMLAI